MGEEQRWVQHMSGQGAKWEVVQDCGDSWSVSTNTAPLYGRPLLPKSEYFICEPPEKWVEVAVTNVKKTRRLGKGNVLDVYIGDTGIGYVEFFTGAFRVKSIVIERRVPR